MLLPPPRHTGKRLPHLPCCDVGTIGGLTKKMYTEEWCASSTLFSHFTGAGMAEMKAKMEEGGLGPRGIAQRTTTQKATELRWTVR